MLKIFKYTYNFIKRIPIFNHILSFLTRCDYCNFYGNSWQNPQIKSVIIFWSFADWKKEFITKYYPEHKYLFIHRNLKPEWILNNLYKNYDINQIIFFVWGKAAPAYLYQFAKKHDIPLVSVEDGFLRSIQTPSYYTKPLSLAFDKQGIYFDANTPSDLENILNFYDFSSDKRLMLQADKLIKLFTKYHLTKYYVPISSEHKQCKRPTFQKNRYKILVIGQSEEDASIKYGSKKYKLNTEIIFKAHKDYPEADIYYRPHPDVSLKGRKKLSSPENLKDICYTIPNDIPLYQILTQVDHVYTISSLVGMEALIHGKKVTTLGAPFYSNWGLTYDDQIIDRRTRKLSLQELVAGSYILYPQYFDPVTSQETDIFTVIKYLVGDNFSSEDKDLL